MYEQRWKDVVVKACCEILKDHKGRILDFGSGRGELTKALSQCGFLVEAVDADPVCVELSSKWSKSHLAKCVQDLQDNFGEATFDVVIALHVLEHLPNPLEYVLELRRISSKYLILAVPNIATITRMPIRRMTPVNIGHRQGWDYPTFTNFLTKYCGLKVVKYIPDLVVAPLISNLLHTMGIRKLVEERLLPRLFPFQTNSIIALCEK